MTIYIITRHGSNAANQSMTPTMIVGTIEAQNESDAKRYAADRWTVYANQFFSARPLSRASKADQWEAEEADRATAEDADIILADPENMADPFRGETPNEVPHA